jgi:hypothetical protein
MLLHGPLIERTGLEVLTVMALPRGDGDLSFARSRPHAKLAQLQGYLITAQQFPSAFRHLALE